MTHWRTLELEEQRCSDARCSTHDMRTLENALFSAVFRLHQKRIANDATRGVAPIARYADGRSGA